MFKLFRSSKKSRTLQPSDISDPVFLAHTTGIEPDPLVKSPTGSVQQQEICPSQSPLEKRAPPINISYYGDERATEDLRIMGIRAPPKTKVKGASGVSFLKMLSANGRFTRIAI